MSLPHFQKETLPMSYIYPRPHSEFKEHWAANGQGCESGLEELVHLGWPAGQSSQANAAGQANAAEVEQRDPPARQADCMPPLDLKHFSTSNASLQMGNVSILYISTIASLDFKIRGIGLGKFQSCEWCWCINATRQGSWYTSTPWKPCPSVEKWIKHLPANKDQWASYTQV